MKRLFIGLIDSQQFQNMSIVMPHQFGIKMIILISSTSVLP